LQDLLSALQSTQQLLCDPQFEFDVPGWQLPVWSQHPAQVPLKQELPELPVLHVPPAASGPLSLTVDGPSVLAASAGGGTPLELVAPELPPLELLVRSLSGPEVVAESKLSIAPASSAAPLDPPLVWPMGFDDPSPYVELVTSSPPSPLPV
jgi:hypothetical protein